MTIHSSLVVIMVLGEFIYFRWKEYLFQFLYLDPRIDILWWGQQGYSLFAAED